MCASVQAVALRIRPFLLYFQPGPRGTGGATSPTTLQCTQLKVDQPKSLLWWTKLLKTKLRCENKQRVASLRQSGSGSIQGDLWVATCLAFCFLKTEEEASSTIREVKRIHETRRVRVRPTSLVKHSWRVEKRLSHWWRVADECDVKKMAHGRLPGSASKLHATASPPSRGRGRLRFASFSGFTVISIWWVSSKGKWKSKKTELWSGSVPSCRTATATHFYWKSPRRGKIHAVPSKSAKGTKSYHAVRSRRCPKSDAAKKKV